ncbi:MAG: hypothetical protein HYU85_01965 [Chloroflexi bacterium]|nr:hypothetical protein [Chloroflexota bacterium]MBI3931269.1 hypothetical protein [Chloroflexota bacterium]
MKAGSKNKENKKISSLLRLEAENILNELTLIKLLKHYGRAEVVGSVASDLIVKLDIDIHLLVEDSNILDVVDMVYHELLELRSVKEVRITDYRKQGAMKIGIDVYPGASGDWSIDIWITNRIEETGFALLDRLRRELRPELREVIMEIKHVYHDQGKLRDGISTLIYEAVLDAGVRNLDEFHKFLSERKNGRQERIDD